MGARQLMMRGCKVGAFTLVELVVAMAFIAVAMLGIGAFYLKYSAFLWEQRAHTYARHAASNVSEELCAQGYGALPLCEEQPFDYPDLEAMLRSDAECLYSVREFDAERPGLKAVCVTVRWNLHREHPSLATAQTLLAARVAPAADGSDT